MQTCPKGIAHLFPVLWRLLWLLIRNKISFFLFKLPNSYIYVHLSMWLIGVLIASSLRMWSECRRNSCSACFTITLFRRDSEKRRHLKVASGEALNTSWIIPPQTAAQVSTEQTLHLFFLALSPGTIWSKFTSPALILTLSHYSSVRHSNPTTFHTISSSRPIPPVSMVLFRLLLALCTRACFPLPVQHVLAELPFLHLNLYRLHEAAPIFPTFRPGLSDLFKDGYRSQVRPTRSLLESSAETVRKKDTIFSSES